MVKLSLTMKKIKLPSHGFWFKASVLAVLNPVLSARRRFQQSGNSKCATLSSYFWIIIHFLVLLFLLKILSYFSRTVCIEMISHLLILANRQWLSIRSVLFPRVLFDSPTPFSDKTRHPFLAVYHKNDEIVKIGT